MAISRMPLRNAAPTRGAVCVFKLKEGSKTMRKSAQSVFLAMSAFAALSFSAAAVAQEGAYIQGDIGLGHLKVDDNEKLRVSNVGRKIKDSYHESGFMPRLSVGYALGNGLRVAGDFTHYKEMKESYDAANGATQNAGVKANGFGLSAIYDFDYGSDFVPYVGGRITANKLKYSAGYAAAGQRFSSSKSKTKAGYGLLLGFGYKLSNEMTLDAGYRYNHMDSDLNAHEVSVGLRYYFN